jgi:hypothetical protein
MEFSHTYVLIDCKNNIRVRVDYEEDIDINKLLSKAIVVVKDIEKELKEVGVEYRGEDTQK